MGLMSGIRKRLSLGGAIALKMILLSGGIVLCNLIALHLQFDWDVTEGRVHSLAPSTLQILERLDEPVRVLVFTRKLRRFGQEWLQRFSRANSLVSFEYIDLDAQEPVARHYGVQDVGTVIVEKGDAYRSVRRLSEQRLAGAILQLIKGGGKKVLFTEGHGERHMSGLDAGGLAKARGLLTSAGYETVQAQPSSEALQDAMVVVIAAPAEEFSVEEGERIRQFVDQGHGLLVMTGPAPGAALKNVLLHFGVEPQDDYVVELEQGYQHPDFGREANYGPFQVRHPVVDRIPERVLLTHVRSLVLSEEALEMGMCALRLSSRRSWGERNLEDRTVTWDRGVDPPGPRGLICATGEPPSVAGKGRLVVVGTASFAANRYIDTAGNKEFWEATVSWLAGDLDYPLVSRREPSRPLDLSDAQLRTILIVCVLLLPAVSCAAGIFVFVRRAQ